MNASAPSPAAKRDTLNLRIKPEDRGLIDRAAALTGKTKTDFVLEAARRAAEEAVLDRTLFAVEPATVPNPSRSATKAESQATARIADPRSLGVGVPLPAAQPLADSRELASFSSGVPSFDDWLKRRAGSNQVSGPPGPS